MPRNLVARGVRLVRVGQEEARGRGARGDRLDMTLSQIILQDYAIMWLVIAVHELGHLSAAIALRLPLVSMKIGCGMTMKKLSYRGVCVEIGLVPLAGSVGLAWPSRRRWKNALVIVAGPAANVLTWALLPASPPRTPVDELAVMSLYVGVMNLFIVWWPSSDGARLLAEFRRRDGILMRKR